MRDVLAGFVLLSSIAVAAPMVEPVDFKKLETWVTDNPTATLDQALQALPESMRRNASWVVDSESSQPADDDHPRGIVYSPSGKLTLAFSGAAGPRREILEVLQFDARTARFELREINFAVRPLKPSPPNPPLCVKCHGADPRPNWASYASWPGVLGSKHFHDSEEEKKKYGDFANAKAKDTRYGHFFLKERTVFPEIAGEDRGDRARRKAHFESSYLSLANSRLTDFFGSMNSLRVARLATATHWGDAIVPAIVAMLEGCKPVASFLPASWAPFAKHLEKNFEAAEKKRAEGPQDTYRTADDKVQRVRLFLSELGAETEDWSMNFDRRDPSFATPSFVEKEMIAAFLPKAKELETVYTVGKPENDSGETYASRTVKVKAGVNACAEVAKASQAKLARFAGPIPGTVPRPPGTHRPR